MQSSIDVLGKYKHLKKIILKKVLLLRLLIFRGALMKFVGAQKGSKVTHYPWAPQKQVFGETF